MKSYLVFAGDWYYPQGGWSDFDSDHDTLEEAYARAKAFTAAYWTWAQVVDSDTGRIEHELDGKSP